MKSLQVILEFNDEQEYEEWIETQSINKAARRVLSQLRQEMRTVVKYGEPTERDEFWYQRLFELTSDVDEGLSAWEF